MIRIRNEYINDGLGGLELPGDRLAALKYALNSIFLSHWLSGLADIMDPASEVGQIEGDPGWTLQRKGSIDIHWPDYALYRAEVDPQQLSPTYSYCYVSKVTFNRLVTSCLVVHERTANIDNEYVRHIKRLLNNDNS